MKQLFHTQFILKRCCLGEQIGDRLQSEASNSIHRKWKLLGGREGSSPTV